MARNKKGEAPLVRHRDCEYAELMQWGNNPVIAECKKNGERHVANSMVKCPFFFLQLDKEITKMK